jgi:tetratricopeptide (TPR) repeat protein
MSTRRHAPPGEAQGAAAPKRLPRPWTMPRAPFTPRPEEEIVRECPGAPGLLLWSLLRAVALWTATEPGARPGLFGAGSVPMLQALAPSLPELADAVGVLTALCVAPEEAGEAGVAAACEKVSEWATLGAHHETAIQFAEAAAWVEPTSSMRASTAARLLREVAAHSRARLWFARAVRLARRARSESAFAIAQLGWGTLEYDQGNVAEAYEHYIKATRAAERNGRSALVAAARHDLFVLALSEDKTDAALQHAERALAAYRKRHLRLPSLVLDIGFLWVRLGYFSSAAYLFTRIEPLIRARPLRILLLSAFARAAAGVRDGRKFERLKQEVSQLLVPDEEETATASFNLAEGLRCFGRWEEACLFAEECLRVAEKRRNSLLSALTTDLLHRIENRETGAVDIVPDEGSTVDRITLAAMRRLKGYPVPSSPEMVLFPARYPID